MAADAFTGHRDIKVCATDTNGLLAFLREYKTVQDGSVKSCTSCKAEMESIGLGQDLSVARKPWTRNELLVLLNIYEKIPFGLFHHGNPVLIDIATHMDRTAGSVAMKLSNLASLDERLRARGIKGLSGASKLDRNVWNEFHGQQELLVPESEVLLAELITGDPQQSVDVQSDKISVLRAPIGPTEKFQSQKVRIGQRFFRQAVLNAYGGCCAVTGLSVRDLLIASHIIPWSAASDLRIDPQNGIALNALHDRAFDHGLITFDTELRLVCAPSLQEHFAEESVSRHFQAYANKPLTLPADAAGPKPEYLEFHRSHVFRG
ncbi:MAG: HNH endonuclease [Flavobacteriales bacterium]|nr:HNH endonuclease [Flavobacteriales bacterium]